jgi:poly-gamma-glutamate synthesis protein (capsule biosynthesis protein)
MLFSAIARAANAGRTVIVSCHWGPNWGVEPPADHVRAARRLIDAGGDVVFGHSPHVVRGVEIYREKPIFYGCGDFIDDYAVDEVERNDLSCVSVLDYEGQQLRRILLYPTIIRGCQAGLAHGADRVMFLARAGALCRQRGTRTRAVPEGLEVPLDIQRSPDGAPAQSAVR